MKAQKGYLLIHKRPFQGLSLRSLWRHVSRWHAVAQERRMLASLSDSALHDLGLSRADVEREVIRPFWDDPMHK
ncbi:DUF1127 domain-containing protein [Pseudomonas sp. Au-Pse12]|uniref:DUF1127 domain-containing protein n=1 Tax=Pseudomonas sp. Au-Pse12 TaxID=2906459 RepID=UPI001E5182CC|nr:DUF1127 domain-containing protein [Pseudomonas sp. Au-Pse12]MCE4053981.1 DUF1127 domain-containing protein [Pseudomonas sp. Au-Pse12]